MNAPRAATLTGQVKLSLRAAGAPVAKPGFNAELHQVDGARYLLQTGPDLINVHLRAGRVWEARTLLLAQALLQDVASPVVVDVGANLGAFAVPMGQWLAPRGGRLVAFEPQRLVYYQLCANLFLNHLVHCEAHLLAVGAEPGFVDVPQLDPAREVNFGALSLDAGIRQAQRQISSLTDRVERVRMVTLSEMGLPAAHLVKVDVEGLELEVLMGARDWLQRCGHPPILFEVWGEKFVAYAFKREQLLRWVRETLGYELTLLGELCVAQHPSRQRLHITEGAGRKLTLTPMPPSPTAETHHP
jgi:FkbM family methyltransferase